MAENDAVYRGTGKRKTSVARVILTPGSGAFTVNGRALDEYFGRPTLRTTATSPLELTGLRDRFDVRALGPSLASGANPIAGTLANPYLELRDGSGNVLVANDNWTTSPQESEIIASMLAPTNSQESAVIATLEPGAYTAIVEGADGGSGIGLVEVFDLDQ